MAQATLRKACPKAPRSNDPLKGGSVDGSVARRVNRSRA